MREILFRGKRVDNGEWVFGNLIEDKWGDDNSNTVYAILQDRVAPEIAALWTPVKVAPETVGQYTGLTDKNGKKIFEGDIVRGKDYTGDRREGSVFYDNYNAMYMIKPNTKSDYREVNCLTSLTPAEAYLEVIGNIHDNSELLKEDEE